MCCVHYDPDTTLTFELKVKFIGILIWLRVWATVFCPLTFCHMSVSPWDNVLNLFMTSVWPWPLVPISKFIFSPWIGGMIVFALWRRHTNFGTRVYHHVYIQDLCMTFTFDLYVGWQVVSFVSFARSFYLDHFLYVVDFTCCFTWCWKLDVVLVTPTKIVKRRRVKKRTNQWIIFKAICQLWYLPVRIFPLLSST